MPGRYIELEGGPDLVVEIVSDTSVAKDSGRMPAAYVKAGAEEYWLVDVRGESTVFHIHSRGDSGFEPVELVADGFQKSRVLACWFELKRSWNDAGFWEHDLGWRGEWSRSRPEQGRITRTVFCYPCYARSSGRNRELTRRSPICRNCARGSRKQDGK